MSLKNNERIDDIQKELLQQKEKALAIQSQVGNISQVQQTEIDGVKNDLKFMKEQLSIVALHVDQRNANIDGVKNEIKEIKDKVDVLHCKLVI